MELKGELTNEQREDLKKLLIAFREANEGHNRTLKISEIKLLPPNENRRLWEYVEHICRLVAMCSKQNHNRLGTLKKISNAMKINLPELVDEAVQEMVIWVYRYTWRTYNPNLDSRPDDKIFVDANYGFINWVKPYINEANMAVKTGEIMKELEDNPNPCGRKVTNANI